MVSRITRALMPVWEAMHEAHAIARTVRTMHRPAGPLAGLASSPSRAATDAVARERSAPSAPMLGPGRPGPAAPAIAAVSIRRHQAEATAVSRMFAAAGPASPSAPMPPTRDSAFAQLHLGWPRPPVQVPRPTATASSHAARSRTFTDLRPPATLAEEQAQLRLALEQSRTEAFLKDLPAIDEHFDAAATAHGGGITKWNELPADVREVYSNELEYSEEAVAASMTPRHIERALTRTGMRAVPNDGIAAGGINNCFLISVLQHATGNFDSSHPALVDQYREILKKAPGVRLSDNEKIFARSAPAVRLIDLINADPDVQPKLKVEVISEVNGVVHRDSLGSTAPDARTVVIWDRGGHFEAVTGPRDDLDLR
ncbi:hypothetical protein LL998_28965 [Burkholderia ambifaria]|uniref:hypothetical protein n=1 Tax=Burkholderia ambifaria TaxID=152480 RepID=UPI001E47C789|nr:hypothetical protein [Burkholderia ambifaria]UEP39282.1 hypothetical protein LL998_28965 [Burkholderia ambifaria]